MIKAVIFDMDGLLIDSEPLWLRALREALGKVGVEVTTEIHRQVMGGGLKDTVAYIYDLQPWDGPSQADIMAEVTKTVIGLMRREGALMPGVHQALNVCKQAGLPVAIASSSAQEIIDAVVDTLEIREHFEHLYSARFEPHNKPHPGVFLSVARHFKVSPRDCLVFEDSINGVRAAKAAKMVCVAVPEPALRNHRSIRTADVVLTSLEEFDERLLATLE